MEYEHIRKEILKATGIYKKALHVGEIPFCEEIFNLIKREDGKWEVFYGEHGCKTNLRVYETEEEAVKGMIQFIKGDTPACLEGVLSLFARWKRRKQDKKTKE